MGNGIWQKERVLFPSIVVTFAIAKYRIMGFGNGNRANDYCCNVNCIK